MGWRKITEQRLKANQPHLAQQELDNTSAPVLGKQWSGPRPSDDMQDGVAELVIEGVAGTVGEARRRKCRQGMIEVGVV